MTTADYPPMENYEPMPTWDKWRYEKKFIPSHTARAQRIEVIKRLIRWKEDEIDTTENVIVELWMEDDVDDVAIAELEDDIDHIYEEMAELEREMDELLKQH